MQSSVQAQARAQQRQIEVMLALGEIVAVSDPETGEMHYMATKRLKEGTGSGPCAPCGPRHAREERRSWRLRGVMVVLASGLVLAAAMPAAMPPSVRPGLHRLIDEHNDDEEPVPSSVPSTSRVAVISGRVTAEESVESAPVAIRPLTSSRAPVPARSHGRHRAGHKSHRSSSMWWWFEQRGVNEQVTPHAAPQPDVIVRERVHT